MKLTCACAVLMIAAASAAEELTVPGADGEKLLVEADSVERDPSGTIYGRGEIRLKHGAVSISCSGTVTIYVADNAFTSLEARGSVEASAGRKKLWGGHLFYEAEPHLITVGAEPRAREGNTAYSAERRILCYADTGVMKFEPRPIIFIDKAGARAEKERKGRKKFLGLF